MYGLGLARGLTVTMKNMLKPSRMFTVHQYPNRRIGLPGLARRSGANVLSYMLRHPGTAFKALAGLATVEDRMPQHPRFRGEEFTWYEERCTGARAARSTARWGSYAS